MLAVHDAFLNSGIEPWEIDLTVTLPISEFYMVDCRNNTLNIERKISNLMRKVPLNKVVTFTIKNVDGLRAGSLKIVPVMNRMSVGRTVCGWIEARLYTINI